MVGSAALLWWLGVLAVGDPPPAREPVRLLTDFDEPRLVERLRALLDGAVPIFERETGARLPDGRVLVVNLYRTLRGYQRGARSAGVSGFMQVGAVTAWSNQESYLALQPRGDAAYLEAVGWLPDLTAQLALHEAAHQFLARAEVHAGLSLPAWYSEGLADHLAEIALRELVYSGGARCLMLDDARRSIAHAAASDATIPLAELFALGELELDGHARRDLFYDQSAALVRYFSGDGRERWGSLLQAHLDELGREGRGASHDERLALRAQGSARWLARVADLPALERDWRGALADCETPWIERLGSSQWIGEDVLVAALAWQSDGYLQAVAPAPAEARRFEAEFALFGLEHGEAFVVLHEPAGDEGGLKLSILPDGLVTLIGWRDGQEAMRGLSSACRPKRDAFVRLAVEHEGQRLAVHLDDEPALVFDLPQGCPAPGGTWGLGARRDAVLWRGARWR